LELKIHHFKTSYGVELPLKKGIKPRFLKSFESDDFVIGSRFDHPNSGIKIYTYLVNNSVEVGRIGYLEEQDTEVVIKTNMIYSFLSRKFKGFVSPEINSGQALPNSIINIQKYLNNTLKDFNTHPELLHEMHELCEESKNLYDIIADFKINLLFFYNNYANKDVFKQLRNKSGIIENQVKKIELRYSEFYKKAKEAENILEKELLFLERNETKELLT
jgi:hypothetical protein